MCFFDLVKEDDAIRASANSFGQLTAFFITHITWRGTEEAGNSVLLMIFTHIHAHKRIFIIKQEFSQSLGQFGLANTGGADEDE